MKMKLVILSLVLLFNTNIYSDHHGEHEHDHDDHEGHDHGGHDHHGHDHHGHGHDAAVPMILPMEQTGPIGRENLQRLIKSNKLDKSWYASSFAGTTKSKDEKNWEVSFKLEKEGKSSILIIKLDLDGKFIEHSKK